MQGWQLRARYPPPLPGVFNNRLFPMRPTLPANPHWVSIALSSAPSLVGMMGHAPPLPAIPSFFPAIPFILCCNHAPTPPNTHSSLLQKSQQTSQNLKVWHGSHVAWHGRHVASVGGARQDRGELHKGPESIVIRKGWRGGPHRAIL